MFCPQCGNQLIDEAKFCSLCGNPASGLTKTANKAKPPPKGELLPAKRSTPPPVKRQERTQKIIRQARELVDLKKQQAKASKAPPKTEAPKTKKKRIETVGGNEEDDSEVSGEEDENESEEQSEYEDEEPDMPTVPHPNLQALYGNIF